MVPKVILQTFANRGHSKKYTAVCQETVSLQCSNSVVYLTMLNRFLTIKRQSPFYLAHTTHSNTHVHFRVATQDTHTHTHAEEVAVNFSSAFSHPGLSFLQGSREQWAAFMAPGDQVKWSFRLGQGRTGGECSVLLHVFLLGFLVEETPCEHAREHANSLLSLLLKPLNQL